MSGKYDNRVALGALDKDQCVIVEEDNVAGYYIFLQDDRYAIGRKEDADLLRRNGYALSNNLI